MTHRHMQLSRKIIVVSRKQCYCVLLETQARNSFPTKYHLVPQPKPLLQHLFSTLLTLHIQPFSSSTRMPSSQALQRFVWGTRENINDTDTRHGVCPLSMQAFIITVQLIRLVPPGSVDRPQEECIRCVKLLVM